jgi:hypothetical protein
MLLRDQLARLKQQAPVHPFGCFQGSSPALVGLVSFADRDLTRFVIPDGGVFQDF